jgi:membrane protein
MLKELLSTPTTQLGRGSRFLVFQAKLWIHCARLLKKNRAGQQAAALSYHTIFGIVPLAIVMLLIFQMFPAYSEYGDKIKVFIYDQANLTSFSTSAQDPNDPNNVQSDEDISLAQHLDQIVGKFLTGTNKGSVGLFSVLLVIWAAIGLLSTIEKAFNNIWHVRRGRNFLQRIINYWALLTLGPLVVAAGLYAISEYKGLAKLQESLLTNVAPIVLPIVLSVLVATTVFFLLYFILPNTKVQAKAAISGAALAGLVWVIAKLFYGYCVTHLGLYRSLYGMMALIPITVMWIHITWLIVLFGLQLTFTTQHLKTLDAAEIAASQKTREHFIANDMTVFNILREIAEGFEHNQGPVTGEVICTKLDMPAEFGERILNRLVDSELIIKTAEPKTGFVPATDPANIKLSDIAKVVAESGFAQSPTGLPAALEQIAQKQNSNLGNYTLKQILHDGSKK